MKYRLAWILIGLLGLQAQAQTLNKAADLKASPSGEAKTLKSLPTGTALKLSKREGFWVEVDAGGAKGWIKLTDIAMGTGAAGGLGAMDTGRAGKGNIVSTSAARGLSAKELVASKPDVKEFEELKGLSVGSPEAEQFAQAGGLKTRTLALLAAPAAPTGTGASKAAAGSSASKKKSKDDEDDDE